MICGLLGIADSLHRRCVILSDDFAVWFADPMRSAMSARKAHAAVCELTEIFADAIRAHSHSGAQDLMRLMIDIAREDSAITPEVLNAQCVLLLMAGHETTRNLIGNGVYLTLQHTKGFADALGDESLVRSTVEEVLRFESPIQTFGSTTTRDFDYSGIQIPAGDSLYFMVGAANRDPAQFANPDSFEPTRPHNRHVAFGADAHVCLGSTLARLEGQIALRGVARRFPRLELLIEQPEWRPGFRLRALRSLPVNLNE